MEEPIVTVKQGKLKGRTGTDYDGRRYYSFQGIPYAKPPVGNLRFKPPEPPDPWDGIIDATREGNVCSQRNYSTSEIIGSEDCLYLNVYTPELPLEANRTLKPVLFWIHGGAFSIGSGNSDTYGPEYLLINDVVVVTINYRVGLLGFLKADNPNLEIPGNAGLRDIVMALRWVNGNIQQFLGDPNNVTIFGESAGSVAVQYILLSASSRGLFHKAIMQSGSVFNSWARGFQNNQLLAKTLKIETSNEKDIVETLVELPIEKLLDLQEQLEDAIAKGIKRPFGPIVEKPNLNPFITEEPSDILASGKYNEVPIIIGYCKMEGNMCEAFANLEERKPVHSSFDEVIPYDLNLKKGSVKFKEVANKLKEFYYKEDSHNTTETYSVLEGDVHFIVGINRFVRMMIEKSKQPIYYCRFSIDTSLNMLRKVLPVTLSGASHGDDLSYLFKSELNPEIKTGSVEDVAIRRMSRLWTNFAKTGNPNSKSTDPLLNIHWKPISKTELNFLDFDKTLTVGIDPDGDRMTFWHHIYSTYSNR